MFPPIETFATGHLPVTDGQTIYWEASGNPDGRPAVYLHGGPGGGLRAGYRRWFDPAVFKIISFEQRGAGRSRPHISESMGDLETNTTPALISDIEALRTHLGVERWLVTGVSWGTTLALAYAQAHRERVTGIVLSAITTTTRREVDWITEAMGELCPKEWDKFADAGKAFPGARMIERYHAAITYPDIAVRTQAAKDWCEWEDVHMGFDPKFGPISGFVDPVFRQNFATLVIHYWKNSAFLGEDQLLKGMRLLAGVPGVMLHGRLDVSSPLRTAWQLHKAWPESELIVIPDEGHGGEKMMAEMSRAISRLG